MEKMDLLISDLREFAKERRISQAEISKETGIAQSNISNMFAGRTNPTLKRIIQIADVIGMDLILIDKQ